MDTIKRRFQLTSFEDNSNKYWQVEALECPTGGYAVTIEFGRVGVSNPPKTKFMSKRELYAKITEKLKKGYVEVDLHAPSPKPATTQTLPSANVPQDSAVTALIADIYAEAGEHIDSYLAQRVDALSHQQIQSGRRMLFSISAMLVNKPYYDREVIRAVQTYYNIIPTKLPRNIRSADAITKSFVNDLAEQDNRLNQLEAALETFSVPAGTTMAQGLGSSLRSLLSSDSEYKEVEDLIRVTDLHKLGMRVTGVYAVTIPSERAAYEANTIGNSNVMGLFHGTDAANVRHILHEHGPGSGLRIPKSYTNGWAFGPGIYLADVASKSGNYCRALRQRMMFVVDAAVGNMHIPPYADSSMTLPPNGFDSVKGEAGRTAYLRYNEYILYRQQQQTIRYVVTWR